ncbi:MAG: energy-coupling factor transporter transmembrane component T family protein [Hyphomicrobium sp.]
MSLALYIHGSSPLHRLAPSVKVALLIAAGIAVFLVGNPLWLMPVLLIVAGLYIVARIPLAVAARQLRPLGLLIGLIFLFHGMFTTWALGLLVVLRLAILVLLGMLVSFTTRVSDMIETIERGLAPLALLGVDPAKVSLALSLALRFIPLLYEQVQDIREAQRVRGLERNFTALAVPLLVRTLRMASDLTDAIEARGFEGSKSDAREHTGGRATAAANEAATCGGKGISRLRGVFKRRSMPETEI